MQPQAASSWVVKVAFLEARRRQLLEFGSQIDGPYRRPRRRLVRFHALSPTGRNVRDEMDAVI